MRVSAEGLDPTPVREGRFRVPAPVRGRKTDHVYMRKARQRGQARRMATVAALVVLAAAAIVIPSAGLLPSMSQWSRPDVPAGTEAPPLFPFYLVGHTFAEAGEVIGGAEIHIQDTTTGAWNNTTMSDPVTGFFICDINNGLSGGIAVGHIIAATAYLGALQGTNQTLLRTPLGSYTQMNITLDQGSEIPEFGTVLLPIAGMLGIVVAVRVASRGRRPR